MTLKKEHDDPVFREKLKNIPKPINDTSCSPEFEAHLNKINRMSIDKQMKGSEEPKYDQITICPLCRRQHSIKKTPSGVYCCGFCGGMFNQPSYVFEPKKD